VLELSGWITGICSCLNGGALPRTERHFDLCPHASSNLLCVRHFIIEHCSLSKVHDVSEVSQVLTDFQLNCLYSERSPVPGQRLSP
jgi:hypothetical protein